MRNLAFVSFPPEPAVIAIFPCRGLRPWLIRLNHIRMSSLAHYFMK